jgi:hypothetical protein
MAKKEKIMTPKKGMSVAWRSRTFKHGDKISVNMAEYFNQDSLTEWCPPRWTLKKGIVKKIGKTEYEHGVLIDDKHVREIQPAFLEPFPEAEPESKSKKKEQDIHEPPAA